MKATQQSPFSGIKHVYVFCPGKSVTGGPELLHQLVSELVRINVAASIVYYPLDKEWTTPDVYLRYQCPVSRTIPDCSDVAVIVPEVATRLLRSFKEALRCIWWLSVNNYRGSFENLDRFKVWIKRTLKPDIHQPQHLIHLFQSQYAADFVRRRFGVSGYFLSDYLADEFMTPVTLAKRQDVVVYNPKKGASTTRRIIEFGRGFEFLPIVNMDRHEVRSALLSAKVYIDFGFHPGKDRIPREAAASGCVVIVGRRGSARNDVDVRVPDKYKLSPWQHKTAVKLIGDVIANYAEHFEAQQAYRDVILGERVAFEREVNQIFCGARLPSAADQKSDNGE